MARSSDSSYVFFREDWLPVAVVVLSAALMLAAMVFAPAGGWLVVAWIACFLPRSLCPSIHHNHSHLRTFRHPLLNGMYDAVIGLIAGYPTAVWEAQHVVGHHANLLRPARDPACRKRFSRSGNFFVYVLAGDICAWYDAYVISREQRRLTRYLWQVGLFLGFSLVFLFWKPMLALLFVILPAQLLRWETWAFSYSQHPVTLGKSVFDSSITRLGLVGNRLFFNLGHHAAHHERPSLHWSLLPARTQEIFAKLPSHLVKGRRSAS